MPNVVFSQEGQRERARKRFAPSFRTPSLRVRMIPEPTALFPSQEGRRGRARERFSTFSKPLFRVYDDFRNTDVVSLLNKTNEGAQGSVLLQVSEARV